MGSKLLKMQPTLLHVATDKDIEYTPPELARDMIVYLMPLHRVFASAEFLDDLFKWGGVAHIRRYGTGSKWGFPFGHAVAAVHYQKGFTPGWGTSWSKAEL